jgi:hypothetical protein
VKRYEGVANSRPCNSANESKQDKYRSCVHQLLACRCQQVPPHPAPEEKYAQATEHEQAYSNIQWHSNIRMAYAQADLDAVMI